MQTPSTIFLLLLGAFGLCSHGPRAACSPARHGRGDTPAVVPITDTHHKRHLPAQYGRRPASGCPQQAPSPACARPLPERPGEQNTGQACSRREPREDKSSGWDVAAIATGCVRVCGVHWRGAGCGTSIQTTGRASTRMPPTGDVTATASAAGRTRASGRWGVTGGCCGGYPT